MKYILPLLITIIVLAVGAAIIKGGFITSRENVSESSVNLIKNTKKLPNEGKAPSLVGIVDWINSEPLTPNDLKGKVVLIDFWTYSCINCVRTFPFVTSWHEKYKDNGFISITAATKTQTLSLTYHIHSKNRKT